MIKKAHKALIKAVDEAWGEEGKGKCSNLPYFESEATDEYPADEDTGKTLFIATQNAVSQNGKEFKVNVYDSKGVKIAQDNIPSVGAGTIANINTSTYVWTYKKTMGVKT